MSGLFGPVWCNFDLLRGPLLGGAIVSGLLGPVWCNLRLLRGPLLRGAIVSGLLGPVVLEWFGCDKYLRICPGSSF